MVKNLTSFPIFARKTKSFSDDLLCQVCFQRKTIKYFLLSLMSKFKGAPILFQQIKMYSKMMEGTEKSIKMNEAIKAEKTLAHIYCQREKF